MQSNNIFKVGLLASALFLAQSAWALGLGGLKVQSTLGHPLKAEIELLGTPDEFSDLSATIASPSEYQMKDLTYLGAFSGATITVEPRANGAHVLSIRTTQSVNEPYLDLLVRVVWSSGQALREYTLLLDPPKPGAKEPPAPPPIAPATEQQPPQPQVYERITPPRDPQQQRRVVEDEMPYTGSSSSYEVESGTVRVERGNTLSQIVAMHKPADITMQQALVAFYEANRKAFIRDNMNLVRSGAELRLPSREEYQAYTPSEARQTVKVQTEEWRNYIAGISRVDNVTTEDTRADTSGSVTTQQVRPTQPSGGTVSLTTPSESTAAQDERIALENRLREAEERNKELERITRQQQELAARQQQSAPSAVEPTPPAATTPATPPASSATPPAATAPEAVVPAVPVAPPVATPPQPKPPVVQPPKQPEPSFISRLFSSSFLMMAGLVLIVAFLIAYVLYRRKRREEDSDSLFTDATSSMTTSSTSLSTRAGGAAPSVAQPRDRGTIGAQSSNSILSEFSREGLGNIETGEVDPLAEADVYLAYGRAQQAEEILHDALKKDSQRQDVYLKLLEVLADQKKSSEFEKVANRLYALSSGQGEYWQRAKVLGQRLLPGNPRFEDAGGFTASPAVAPRAKPAADPNAFAPMDTPSVAQSIAQAAGRAVERRSQASSRSNDNEGDSLLSPQSSLNEMSEAHFSLEPLGSPQDDLGVDIDLEELSRFRNFGKSEESVAIDTSAPDLTKTQPATKSNGDLTDLDLSFEASVAKKPESFSSMTSETEGGWNDVATKLDLARAYQATGDAEACREILQEVLKEGDDRQKAEAKAILQSLQGA